MKYQIYTISCASTKVIRYIGVTTRKLNKRLYQHKHLSRKITQQSLPVSKWIFSLHENIQIDLLDECTENEWELIEKYWISQFRTWGFSLLNLDQGGKGINRGRRKESEQSKYKSVDQFSKDGTYIRTFSSIKEAVENCGLKSKSSLTNILKNKHENIVFKNEKAFAGGYRWSYKGQPLKTIRRYIITKDGMKHFFYSMREASTEFHFCRDKAISYLKGKRGPIKGLNIEYDIV